MGQKENLTKLSAEGLKICIVTSLYNKKIIEGLVTGAKKAFLALGGKSADLHLIYVPGAYEIPLMCKEAALAKIESSRTESAKMVDSYDSPNKKFDAIVALGCVIRGETTHYEIVAGEAGRGVQQVMLETRTPIGFGVITTETEEQSIARSSDDENNKGKEAMEAAVWMVQEIRGIY